MNDFNSPELFQEHKNFIAFILFKIDRLYTKIFSNPSTQKEVKVTLFELDELPLEEIKGFVTAVYNSINTSSYIIISKNTMHWKN